MFEIGIAEIILFLVVIVIMINPIRFIKKQNKNKFNIGDTVKVKEWNDMVDEFGYYEEGERIETISETSGLLFIKDYKQFCGKCYKIVGIEKDDIYETKELIYILDTDEAWPAQFCDTQLIKCKGDNKNEIL